MVPLSIIHLLGSVIETKKLLCMGRSKGLLLTIEMLALKSTIIIMKADFKTSSLHIMKGYSLRQFSIIYEMYLSKCTYSLKCLNKVQLYISTRCMASN